MCKTSIHRDGDAINASDGGDGGDDVAGDVGGDVGGSKIRPRPLCCAVYCASLGGVGIMLLLPEKPWICSLGFRENIHFENGLLIMQVDLSFQC